MSNTISNQNYSQTQQLLKSLVDKDSHAFQVKDGKVESSGTMAVRSGLNWMGFGKIEEDVKTNRDTITFLMGEIEKGTSKEVREKLWNSVVDIGDGKKLKLSERFERGTYVSSNLVQEMRYLTGKFWREEQGIQQQNNELNIRYHDGRREIQGFLGKEKQQDGIGDVIVDGIVDGVSKLAKTVFGISRETEFDSLVKDLCQHGSPNLPRDENSRLWDCVEDLFARGGDKDRALIMGQVERHLAGKAAAAAHEGRTLTKDEIREYTREFLTGPKMVPVWVSIANHDRINKLSSDDVIGAVREWAKVNNRPDLENACQWLAGELELTQQDDWQQMVRPLRDMQRDTSIMGKLKEFLTFEQYDEGRDVEQIGETIYKSIRDNYMELRSEDKNKTQQERFQDLCKLHGDDLGKIWQEFTNPHQFTDRDLAMLIGNDTIEKILVEHQEKMDKLNIEEVQLKKQQRENLTNALPFEVFPGLHTLKNKMTDDVLRWMGQPETAGDFVKGMLQLSMHQHVSGTLIDDAKTEMTEQLRKEGKLQEGEAPDLWLSNEKQEEIVNQTKDFVKTEMEQLDKLMPSLDEFRKFEQELGELSKREGGLKGLPKQELDRLDTKARELRDVGYEMIDLQNSIKERFRESIKTQSGVSVEQGTNVLGQCGRQLINGVRSFIEKSEGRERFNEYDKKVLEDGMQVMRDIMQGLETLINPPPLREIEWAREDLREQIRPFKPLHTMALNLPHEWQGRFGHYDSIGSLVTGMVLGPHQDNLTKSVGDDYNKLQMLMMSNRQMTKDFDTEFGLSLRSFDTFSQRMTRYNELGDDWLRSAGPDGRNALREQITREMEQMKTVDRLIGDLGTRFQGSLDGLVKEGLEDARDRLLYDGQLMLDMLDQLDREPEPTQTDVPPPTNQTTVGQTGGPSLNPFDGDDDDVPPPSSQTVTNREGGLNPFEDDEVPLPTDNVGSNTVTFDRPPPSRPPPPIPGEQPRVQGTNPFSDPLFDPPPLVGTGGKSLNPFDEFFDEQGREIDPITRQPVPQRSLNPFDEDFDELGNEIRPPSVLPEQLGEQLNLYPPLRTLAQGLPQEQVNGLAMVSDLVQQVVSNGSGRTSEQMQTWFSANKIDENLLMLDRFSALQRMVDNNGEDGLRSIGKQGRQDMRMQVMQAMGQLSLVGDARTSIENEFGTGNGIGELTDALRRTQNQMQQTGLAILDLLHKLDEEEGR